MPDITDAEYRQWVRYQNLGTPDDLERLPKKVSDLEGDNKTQRDEIRSLKEAAKPVPEGGRIVTKEEAERFDAYIALGAPDEVKQKIVAGEEATGRLGTLERKEVIRSAAQAMGWKPEVLENLPHSDGWSYEVREETVRDAAGKETKAKVVFVVPAAGKEAKPLAKHVEEDGVLSAFLPALKAEAQSTTPSSGPTRFPASPATSTPRDGKLTEDDVRKATERTVNYNL